MQQLVVFFLFFALVVPAHAVDYAANIASLIDPAKLATLKSRGANPRVQECVYWLEAARIAGENPTKVAQRAVSLAGYPNAAAQLTTEALLRNHKIATELGCLDPAGQSRMRRGESPIVQKGPRAGDVASADHIIPRAVAPELDNVIANLELLPLRLNESKNSKIGQRQIALAKRLHWNGE